VAQRRPAILFHHGIGASAALVDRLVSRPVDRHPLPCSTCAAAGARTFRQPAFGVARQMVDDLYGRGRCGRAGTLSTSSVIDWRHRGAGGDESHGRTACDAHRQQRRPSRRFHQRVQTWQKQLGRGRVKGWSDAFMPDRFHDRRARPERWAWFAAQQEAWPRESILKGARRPGRHRSDAAPW